MNAAMSEAAPIHVIGGGLAGSEAAWQIDAHGVPVVLHEMRPTCATAAHKTDRLAELVCSNSFRSDDAEHNAVGLLHQEMRLLDSLVMRAADANQVPAGGALAVDREGFAAAVTAALSAHPLVTLCREEIAGIPPAEWDNVIVATGPLTSPALAEAIANLAGEEALAFFDAIAPICIAARSICRLPGCNRATTGPGPAVRAPTTSIARSHATNTTPSSMPCWPARR